MWGFETVLHEGKSAGDDYSIIFDKVQDTMSRLTSIFEMGGLHKRSTEDFGWPLKVDHWVDLEDETRHAYVHYTDPRHSNLISNVIIQTKSGVHTFRLLSHDQYANPYSVTGEVAEAYIENLDELDDWLKSKLSEEQV
jgi:hypothetical protein